MVAKNSEADILIFSRLSSEVIKHTKIQAKEFFFANAIYSLGAIQKLGKQKFATLNHPTQLVAYRDTERLDPRGYVTLKGWNPPFTQK